MPFLAEAFTVYLEKVKTKKSPRTYDNYKYLYEKYIKKELGQFQIDAITRADIARLHHKHANKPHTANRLLALFSTFLTWCERHGHRTEGPNPCRHIEKYRETPRDPGILSEQDLFKLGKALNAYEQENMYLKEQPHKKVKTEQLQENPVTPYVTAAIRLLIFTGARRNEILTLKWENVDFQNRQLRLQESKTGQKSIYLSAPALQLLSTIPRVEGNPYVICGKNEGEHLVNIKNPWGKIRKKAGLEKLRLHDLRHNYASTAVATGHHLKVVGALLGHSEIKTTERYAHLANDPVQTANETVSNRILNAMMGKTSQDNVVKNTKSGLR
ncbi:MAG: site-specific integrase [Alphaproteobacteria bacterium]|nr:site-specific integrase [Alphaproteobacteria bacterium]